jgi:hypothetical protein
MKFDRKFFTAPTQIKSNLHLISQNPQNYQILNNLQNSGKVDFQSNNLRFLFYEKLNFFSCLTISRNLFPKIIEKILIMEAEFLQKMIFDDNYFINQVNLIINFIFRNEKQ